MTLASIVPSFIGVAGVKTRAEAVALQKIAREVGLPPGRRLAVGALVSYRGLAFGELADPNQYVHVDKLPELMLQDRDLMNVTHYNSRADGLPRQIHSLLRRVQYADAVQLNVVWPAPAQMERLRWETFMPVVLQAGAVAYAVAGGTPEGVIGRLRQYLHQPTEPGGVVMSMIDYVLIDPSGGLGREFDQEFAFNMLAALVVSELPMRWGIAGGLSPDNVQDKIGPLLGVYPQLSWDAQSLLRTPDRTALDLAKCQAFVEASVDLLRGQ